MADMSNEHILLIDDDLRLSAMVGDYLRSHGYEVSSAPSLATGRELLARQPFDALVLDLMLPDGDGLELTRRLQQALDVVDILLLDHLVIADDDFVSLRDSGYLR